jgi:hypothetical protein
MPNTVRSDSRTFRHFVCGAVLALPVAIGGNCAAQQVAAGSLDGIPFSSENVSGADFEAALLSLLFLALALALPLHGLLNARGRKQPYWAVGAAALCAGIWILAQSAVGNFLVPSAAFWKLTAMLAIYLLPAALSSFVAAAVAPHGNGAILFLNLAKLHIVFAVFAMFVVATGLLTPAVTVNLFYILLAVTVGAMFYHGTIAVGAGNAPAAIFVLGLALNLLTALAALADGRAGFVLPLRHPVHWGLLALLGGMTAIAQLGARRDDAEPGAAAAPAAAAPSIPSRRERKWGGGRYSEAPAPPAAAETPPQPEKMPAGPGAIPAVPQETPAAPLEITPEDKQPPAAPQETPGQEPRPDRDKPPPAQLSPRKASPAVADGLTEQIREFAHEINTPLGAGMLAASHLEQQVKKLSALFKQDHLRKSDLEQHLDNYQKTAEIILTNFRTAAEMTKSLRAGRDGMEKQAVDLKKLVGETFLRLSPKIKEAGHRVHIRCDDDLVVMSLPRSLGQILANLTVNSLVHAYDPGVTGNLTVDISYENGNIDLRYGDDGKGMERDILRQIFTPHFTTNEKNGSTGLGLAIVETEVNKLGGTIECVSMPGVGTIFTVRFPAERK